MACEEIQAKIQALSAQADQVRKEMMEEPPQDRGPFQQMLKKLGDQLVAAQAGLRHCLESLQPQKVSGTQPRAILEIVHFQNPGGFEPADDWAPRIANGEFPLDQGLQWKQVLDSDDEYDEFNPVGATGWAIIPHIAHRDNPFSHPFGNDWEFEYALDPAFNFLLARGNMFPKKEEEDPESKPSFDIAKDTELIGQDFSPGLLGVEADSGLLPQQFKDLTSSLDRIAVFGRWIVDTGHNEPDHPFRAEIHPPLLMASASVYQRTDGTRFTRALVTSRPYLVGQTFGKDTAKLYQDGVDDDGHLLGHLAKEITKILTAESTQLEAHPKIKSNPFRGIHVQEIVVRTTQPKPTTTTGIFHLGVSFHFTVRNGCSVQVIPNDDTSVRVVIAVNSVGYAPPALPHRKNRGVSVGELQQLNEEAGFYSKLIVGITALINPVAALILSQGVDTDDYDPLPSIDLLSTQNSAYNVPASNIPAGVGISHDDSQPYPVYGWIDIGWALADHDTHGGP